MQQGKPKLLSAKPLDLTRFGLKDVHGYPVSVGNPHLVILGCRNEHLDVFESMGAALEHHPFFPNRCNVEFCQVETGGKCLRIVIKMWERGAGRTAACGSGACAATAAAVAAGYEAGTNESTVLVSMEGGDLIVTLDKDGVATHEGAATFVFRGTYTV